MHSTAHSTIGSTIVVVSFYTFATVCSFFHHVVPQNVPRTKYTRKTVQTHQSTNGSIFSIKAKMVSDNSRASASFFGAQFQTLRTDYDSCSVWIEKCVQVHAYGYGFEFFFLLFVDLSNNSNSKNCGIEPVLAGYWNSIQRDKYAILNQLPTHKRRKKDRKEMRRKYKLLNFCCYFFGTIESSFLQFIYQCKKFKFLVQHLFLTLCNAKWFDTR